LDFDAIVIGAGHNGLASAVHLASKGWSVGVFEANPVAGGAVQTREVTLPGFRHDLFAMNLSLFAGSPFLKTYRERLAAHGLAFAPAADCFASAFPDGRWLGISQDLETTLARLAVFSADDAAKWRAMVGDFAASAPHIFAALGAPMPSWQLARTLMAAGRKRGMGWLLDFLRLALSSPRDFLDANFTSPAIKAAIAAWGLHLDFPPDAAGGALFPYLESMANQSFGMVIGKGGADVMIRALTGAFESLGGKLHLGAEVTAITTRNGRAIGIGLADGRRVSARRAVIANLTPPLVFGRLLKDQSGRPDVEAKMRAFRAGPGTMMIHFALHHLPPWAAGEALQRFAYVHLAPDLAMMTRAYAQAMAGLLPAKPVLVVGQPTAIDASRAPAGKHILWVQVRVLPSDIVGDEADTIATRDWAAAKQAYADRVVGLIESYAPGFAASILARSVFSPTDLQNENRNLIGGDNLAGSHHLDQFYFFRPVAGWSRYRTPVDNLYLVGASTWPGAGVGAGSGFILARMLAG
jgi:phytoene dehydrogenase-like protein